jgi:hypothetical protein
MTKRIALLAGLLILSGSSATFAASVSLAWDPSTDQTVVGYKLYYGPATRSYTNSVDVGNSTSTTVSNLVAGATYFFAATAYDTTDVESDYSTEVSTTIPVPNQQPTLNTLANVTINENATAQTVSLAGISSGSVSENQTLTVTATSSNPTLIPNPSVTYTSPNATGSISFAPTFNNNGTATISVTVNDGGTTNNTITRTFTVTVRSVNQVPTLDPIGNVTVNENSGVQTVSLTGISSGAANENQILTVTASSGNTTLISNPTVNYSSPNGTGSISFVPVTNAFGSTTLTVTVNDGGASNNIVTRTFTVAVSQVNTPPTITAIPAQTVVVGNSTAAVPFTIGDLETAATSLTVSAASDNATLVKTAGIVFGGTGANRTVTVTPVAGQTGSANITVTVTDGASATASRTFALTVRPKPVAPANLHIAQVN